LVELAVANIRTLASGPELAMNVFFSGQRTGEKLVDWESHPARGRERRPTAKPVQINALKRH
jgi:hypothetical protein